MTNEQQGVYDAEACLIEVIAREMGGGTAEEYDYARKITTRITSLIQAHMAKPSAGWCRYCDDRGRVDGETCRVCNGTRRLPKATLSALEHSRG